MSDEIELLRRYRCDPPAPDAQVRQIARLKLAHAIAAERRPACASTRPQQRSRGLWLRSMVVAALGLACTLGLIAALDNGASAPPALAAHTVLRRLAQVAGTRGSRTPGAGQFLHTATTSLTSTDTVAPGGVYCQAIYRQYRRDWIAASGEGLTIEQDGPPSYRSPVEARACKDVPLPAPATRWNWAAPGCMLIDPVPLSRLPRDPARLRARLLTGKVEGGPPGPAEAFTQIGDLLRKTDAPAPLRAALFTAASGLRGVRSLGEVTDRQGRRGVALAIDDGVYRSELVFSLASSDLLEERQLLVRPQRGVQARPGATLSWTTYSTPKVVDALPKPSPLPLTPRCIEGGETGRQVPGHPDQSVNVGFRPTP
jgi:hypothetical protein